jgi:hypothetical protein
VYCIQAVGNVARIFLDIDHPVSNLPASFDAKSANLICAAKQLQFEGDHRRKGFLYEPGKRSGAYLNYKINRCQGLVIGDDTAITRSMH